jgi:hypothetical protein
VPPNHPGGSGSSSKIILNEENSVGSIPGAVVLSGYDRLPAGELCLSGKHSTRKFKKIYACSPCFGLEAGTDSDIILLLWISNMIYKTGHVEEHTHE